MRINRALLFCLFALAASKLQATVLSGPITNSANGHAYYLLAPTNWYAAEAEAISLGGHMTTINDSSENTWIVDTFGSFGGEPRSLWIGLNDTAAENQFVWVDGATSFYRNWAAGEPNNGAGYFAYENHGVIRGPDDPDAPGKWNDAIDGQHHAAVVEVGPPPASPMIVAGPLTNLANGHVYYLLAPTNWNTAESAAVSLGGHLAAINDGAENDWVLTNFAVYIGTDHALWLGYNDVQQEGQFNWVNGSLSTYQNWAAGEPNDGAGFFPTEDQAAMYGPLALTAGYWADAPEEQHHFGVVEIGPTDLQAVASSIRISHVAISWNSSASLAYQVQYRTNLNANDWFNIGSPVLGTGQSMSVTDEIPVGSVQKFYRVLTSQ